jgi:hypothetical protein
MGSLARKLKREQAKRDYQQFAKEWRQEKARRKEASEKGEGTDEKLGKRPPFKFWSQAVSAKAREIEAAIKAAVSKEKLAEEVKDLSWEEEDDKSK